MHREKQNTKGWSNATNLSYVENYIPISLLSVLYKLFTRIITQRITNKSDNLQPQEQAGFRAVLTYGKDTWLLNKSIIHKLQSHNA